MLIILVVIYYIFLRYSPEQIITYSGYAIEGKEMVENLKSSDKSKLAPYLGLIAVQENDLIYKKLNSYYIGEDDKKEIDINYPIYINEGNALLNLGKNTKLITVNYEKVEGYPDFMMADGVMYNGADITRADGNKYLFLKSEDEIYTNVEPITITTSTGKYTIKEYSNIYFAEDHIAYYEMEGMQGKNEQNENNEENKQNNNLKDSYLEYKQIKPIDPDSKTKINGETITYKTLLERLEILQTEESNNESNNNKENATNETKEDDLKNTTNEENTIAEETTGQNSNISNNQNTTDTENNNSDKDEDEWQEGMWEKPEVSCTDFESDVYTIRTNLSVRDRAGVITRGITFEIYLDGRLNRRVQASQAGTLEITNLQPSSEYEIRGIFYYNDENGVEQEEEFYTGKVTTKSIDTLGTLDFSFQNGKIYSNKIELIHLKLNNNINEEVVRGISRVQVEIGDVAYRLTNAQIDELKAGKEITYQTSENLTSNSKIKYEITAFDRYGNELKEKNNTGETITSKQAPTSSIRVTKQDVTEVDLEITLTNKDNVSLENYRYEITNQSGDVVKQGTLGNNGVASNGNKDDLVFTDLDPNGYYQIVIYGDYDLENGEGEHQNSELGRGSFVTRPIASLGYMQVKIDDKEVTQDSMNLGISIDTVQTDARLVAILNKVEVVIYDQGKNTDNGSDENNGQSEEETQGTEIKRITLTDEEVEKLKTSEEIELNLEQLTSNTKYRIDVITTVKQGSVEEVVEDKQNIDQIITLKMPAEVQIRNQFVIGTMIDLDMRIEDIDGADLVDKVRIEVRDKDNKLVDLSEMPTNAEWERKTYEDLTPNETYTILVYAPQYNEGSTDATYKADYLLKKIEIVTETGISGKLDLIGLEKTPTGKNLIDVSSKVNWFVSCFNIGNYNYPISYDENTNILTFLGTNQWSLSCMYYDLSKYIGKEITVSFKAKSSEDTTLQIMEKREDDFSNVGYVNPQFANVTTEWKEYSYTLTLSKTGYLGFYEPNSATIEFQNLQVELGNRKTDYEEFKYDYNANIAVTVIDARNEIITNDYYVRIYKNNEQIQEIRYEEIGEENKVENVQKSYNIEPNETYKIELLVKIADRYYELDSQEFSTEGSREVKGILNKNDFLKIQPFGEYIVLSDLDLSDFTSGMYRFGADNLQFNGKINFNGKTLTRGIKNSGSPIFYSIGKEGIIENLDFNIKMDNNMEKQMTGGLAFDNYGSIKNIIIKLTESSELRNSKVALCVWENYGTIENFILNFEVSLYVNNEGIGLTSWNYGVVKNGYAYGENIKLTNSVSSSSSVCSVIVRQNSNNAILENIYTLVSIDNLYPEGKKDKACIVLQNVGNATVQNVYSVGFGENTDLTLGPNVYSKVSKKIYNNYYFSNETFTSKFETKGNKLSLWDAEFQNQLINTDEAFIVDDLVNEGYYPQLNLPDIMPAQEYIELPEVKDADLPDILSTKVLEQGTDTVKVQFSVNNPSAEQITEINIQNIEVEILSQEYNNGKSIVIAELKNPIICVSKYNVISLTVKGAFGGGYTRPYEEGERVINVDLYKEIWDVNDWKAINESPTENYMLMTDLDFINEGNTVNVSRVDGIINGNGHTISNINLTNNYYFIGELYGTLENLFIDKFNQSVSIYGGAIATAKTNSLIDNVHLKNVQIYKNYKNGQWGAGGLLRIAQYCTVKNCSVNNIKINTEGTSNEISVGGLVGISEGTTIENCFVQGLNVTDSRGVSSGIGGIVGIARGSNRIKACYSEGIINSDNFNVGGIVGKVESKDNIENCYSKVTISTTNINVGGIIGSYSETDLSTIENNLSIGNIYTTSGINTLNRIVGNNNDTVNNNYAYENQKLNGYISKEEKGATLLDKNNILNLNLGESYNYDNKSRGILPKLYNTEGTELLPNQSDILLDNTSEDMSELEVKSIEASKPNTTEAEISISINNPEQIEITGVIIEDMTVTEVSRNVTQNGMTNIVVKATPNRYYDSYKLTGIYYKDLKGEEKIVELEAEIEVQFYKEIYTYEDWQSIEEGTYQNYRLMADIDFSGRTNVKNNITVNRLEAENRIYTLKNIDLSYDSPNTGLINNVKSSIKNIGFENIKLTNTSNSGNYFGVISSNSGNMENLNFKDIIINAKGISYLGCIGGMVSGDGIKNIKLQNITINGNGYIGGLLGYIKLDKEGIIKDIKGNNLTIEGKSNYVGGIIGYQYGKYLETSNISISDSNIKGNDYTGGIWGYIYYYKITYLVVNNLDISGHSHVGGIAGYSITISSATEYLYQNMEILDSDITGTGNYIGGVTGYSYGGNIKNFSSSNCTINIPNSNSEDIGGVVGRTAWVTVSNFDISKIEIYGKGKNVGGIIGNNADNESADGDAINGYLSEGFIEGNQNVGGAVGRASYGSIRDIYINANVNAEYSCAGGVFGYMDNTRMTASGFQLKVTNSMVLDTQVKSSTKSGGIIGDMAKAIYREQVFYYNNYIDADVTSDNTSTGSLIIGGRPDENPYITNTYVYKYSTLNGDYVYTTNDNIDDKQYLVRNDLDKTETFRDKIGLGTTYLDYSSLAEGKYPKIKDSYLYEPDLQTGIDLPTDPDITIINSLNDANTVGNKNNLANTNDISTQSIEALPTITAYPVSVNEINIDFSSMPEGVSFTYYINGQEKEKIDLANKTYTFNYNYQDTLEIKLTNSTDEETITINPDNVRSEASLVGDNNAYILGTSLFINGELQQGEYVNVYGGFALNKNGQVFDIATKQLVRKDATTTTILSETAKPLHTYNYKDNNIEVYGTYSKVNDNVKSQIYNVRSGILSALSNNLDMKINNYISDNYNNKEYQTILSKNGEIVDLKEKLQYPGNFFSRNIKQIVQNNDQEKTEMMVLYNTGKVIVFNYVTGEVIYENDEKADEGLVDYIAGSVSNIWDNYEEKQEEYSKGKELAAKLSEMPIEEAMKQKNNNNNGTAIEMANNEQEESNTITNSADNYITVYNGNTDEYDVYSANEIIGGEEENPVSETEKIKQNGLENIYKYATKEETKPQTNGAVIVAVIIVVAIIALVILRRIIINNNRKK